MANGTMGVYTGERDILYRSPCCVSTVSVGGDDLIPPPSIKVNIRNALQVVLQ